MFIKEKMKDWKTTFTVTRKNSGVSQQKYRQKGKECFRQSFHAFTLNISGWMLINPLYCIVVYIFWEKNILNEKYSECYSFRVKNYICVEISHFVMTTVLFNFKNIIPFEKSGLNENFYVWTMLFNTIIKNILA